MALTESMLKTVEFSDKPYRIKDTGGLFAEIRPSRSIVFRMRYWYHQRDSLITFGEWPHVKLRDAREKRDEIKRLLFNDIDPAALKSYERSAAERRLPTFGEVAREWLEKKKAESRSEKTKYVNEMRLEKYIIPVLADLTPDEITAPVILNEIIRPIEAAGHPETAHRVLNLCGQVFRYGVASGRASRDPSGDLRGALLAAPVKHYPHFTDKGQLGDLVRAIDGYRGLVVRNALRLLLLTFVRPGELRHAEWHEVDYDAQEWRIPGPKMKMKRPHVVPLSTQAIALLEGMKPQTGRGRYIFPSARTPSGSRPMSDAAMLVALRSMGYTRDELVPHGFRHMAATMLNESGLWSPDAIERQMAHVDRNAIRAIYNSAEYMPERRRMMQWWADYLDELRGSRPLP